MHIANSHCWLQQSRNAVWLCINHFITGGSNCSWDILQKWMSSWSLHNIKQDVCSFLKKKKDKQNQQKPDTRPLAPMYCTIRTCCSPNSLIEMGDMGESDDNTTHDFGWKLANGLGGKDCILMKSTNLAADVRFQRTGLVLISCSHGEEESSSFTGCFSVCIKGKANKLGKIRKHLQESRTNC